MSKDTWVNENKGSLINLFEVSEGKEADVLLEKLNNIELEWSNQEITMRDIVDSWNEMANNHSVTLGELSEAYARISPSNEMSIYDINEMVTRVFSYTKQSGAEIGNFLRSVFSRVVGLEVVKKYLSDNGIDTQDDPSFTEVIERIKNYLNTITDKDERENKTVQFSEIVGGKYNISRMTSLLND